MADYTKRERRKAELARFIAQGVPPEPLLPLCDCGEPAVIEVNRWPRIEFYCADHIVDASAAFGRT